METFVGMLSFDIAPLNIVVKVIVKNAANVEIEQQQFKTQHALVAVEHAMRKTTATNLKKRVYALLL